MKKAIAGGLLFISIIPFNAFAVTSASVGIEFLSPLVQTIIGLLQERIAILSAENTNLRQQVASCQTLGGQTNTTPEPTSQVQAPQVVQSPTPQPIIQTVQTVGVNTTYVPGDRCPTITLSSDKPFFVQKLAVHVPVQTYGPSAFNGQDALVSGNTHTVVLNKKSATLQSYRICVGPTDTQPTLTATLLGAESLIYGADGVRIPIQDVVFTY